jgi:hypothetical protein
MKHVDMRKLPAATQEERRQQVIGLRRPGMIKVWHDQGYPGRISICAMIQPPRHFPAFAPRPPPAEGDRVC